MRANDVEYFAPARFDDELEVYVRVSRIGTTSVTFEFAAYKIPEDMLLVTAHQTLVHIDLDGRKATPVPDAYRATIASLEGDDVEHPVGEQPHLPVADLNDDDDMVRRGLGHTLAETAAQIAVKKFLRLALPHPERIRDARVTIRGASFRDSVESLEEESVSRQTAPSEATWNLSLAARPRVGHIRLNGAVAERLKAAVC